MDEKLVTEKEDLSHLQDKRIMIGTVMVISIELPLIVLLSVLVLNDLISFFIYYFGLLIVGIGGLLASIAASNWYIKRKVNISRNTSK